MLHYKIDKVWFIGCQYHAWDRLRHAVQHSMCCVYVQTVCTCTPQVHADHGTDWKAGSAWLPTWSKPEWPPFCHIMAWMATSASHSVSWNLQAAKHLAASQLCDICTTKPRAIIHLAEPMLCHELTSWNVSRHLGKARACREVRLSRIAALKRHAHAHGQRVCRAEQLHMHRQQPA